MFNKLYLLQFELYSCSFAMSSGIDVSVPCAFDNYLTIRVTLFYAEMSVPQKKWSLFDSSNEL